MTALSEHELRRWYWDLVLADVKFNPAQPRDEQGQWTDGGVSMIGGGDVHDKVFLWTSDQQIEAYGMSFAESGDAVPGGYNERFTAHDPDGKRLGHIDVNMSGDEGVIADLEVEPDARRQKVATKLLEWFRRYNQNVRLEHGMTTPEGTAWREALPPEYQGVIPSWEEEHGKAPA